MKKNVVIFTGPVFYSFEDEDLFFHWLYSLDGVKEVTGSGYQVHLIFKSSRLTQHDRWELTAIFTRYKLDMRVLRPLLEPESQWSSQLHWFNKVFGTTRKRKALGSSSKRVR